MKLLVVIFIMLASYFVGYLYKNNLKDKLNFYLYLKDLLKNIEANINLFKNNIVDIIDAFILNKNAKYNEIYIKNGQLYVVLDEKLKKYAINESDILIIKKYFNELGLNDYEYEIKKINEIEKYLSERIIECESIIKNKGELFFKIALSVGAVVAILIW